MRLKIDLVRSVEAAARKMEKRIRQVKVMYRDARQRVRIAGSDGMSVDDDRTQIVLTLLIVGEESGELQTAYEAIGGFCGFELFSDERVEAFVKSTVERLSGLLDAQEGAHGDEDGRPCVGGRRHDDTRGDRPRA